MNAETICCLSAIASALIETEAMKAANAKRADQGFAQAYDEDAFRQVAENMREQIQKLASFAA